MQKGVYSTCVSVIPFISIIKRAPFPAVILVRLMKEEASD
jgi:hypothetical protein